MEGGKMEMAGSTRRANQRPARRSRARVETDALGGSVRPIQLTALRCFTP